MFGRSEEQELAQFTASYNSMFDNLYRGETHARGVTSLPAAVMEQIHSAAVEHAMIKTYKPGQRVRITSIQVQGLFLERMREQMLSSLQRRSE